MNPCQRRSPSTVTQQTTKRSHSGGLVLLKEDNNQEERRPSIDRKLDKHHTHYVLVQGENREGGELTADEYVKSHTNERWCRCSNPATHICTILLVFCFVFGEGLQ